MELFRRLVKKRFAHERISGPRIRHEHLAGKPGIGLRNHCGSAVLDCFRRQRMAVDVIPSDADKRAPRPHFTGVVGDKCDLRVEIRQCRGNPPQQF